MSIRKEVLKDKTDDKDVSPLVKFIDFTSEWMYVRPVKWFRANFVERFRGPVYPYYHKRYNRVPTIDKCEIGDAICEIEADIQAKRDKRVDGRILELLNRRVKECQRIYKLDYILKCDKMIESYEIAKTNYFIKYGEIGYPFTAAKCLMKQKHRMIWERRHPDQDLSGLSTVRARIIDNYRNWGEIRRRRHGVDKLIKEFDEMEAKKENTQAAE
ncbi:hypothetical protein ACOME3_002945 [Neoechinorhynchus agilis]